MSRYSVDVVQHYVQHYVVHMLCTPNTPLIPLLFNGCSPQITPKRGVFMLKYPYSDGVIGDYDP